MKKFLSHFIHEDSGAELIEWAIILGIVAILGAAVLALAQIGKGKIDDASALISSINPSSISGANGGSDPNANAGGGANNGLGTE